jgi:hypothetical protein
VDDVHEVALALVRQRVYEDPFRYPPGIDSLSKVTGEWAVKLSLYVAPDVLEID